MKITPERIAQTKDYIAQYAKLQNTDGDVVRWIQMKFSCTRREAQRLVDAANA
jgi:hypothetical protein